MKVFYFKEGQSRINLETLQDGRYYTEKSLLENYLINIPHKCEPVWCPFTWDYELEEDKWLNPVSGREYYEHPLGLTNGDGPFYEGFYEITYIEDLTFEEGDIWNHKTNKKDRVENPNIQTCIWNSFRRCYEPRCDECFEDRIKHNPIEDTYHTNFTPDEMHLYFEVYCRCSGYNSNDDFDI